MESSEPNGEVHLPGDIKEFYELAKEASTYYEELTRTWNENALARFRDTLDHIISASQINCPDTVNMHLGNAREHLSEIISEPIQNAALIELDRIDKRLKWRRLKDLVLVLPSRDEVKRRQKLIGYELQEGRNRKGALQVERAKEGFDHFIKAYEAASELSIMLDDAHVRWRSFVKVLLWLLPIAIGIAVALWQ